MKFLWEDIRVDKGQLSLFLLIFQSIGIRFIQGQGVALLILVILLNTDRIQFLLNKWVLLFTAVLIFIGILQGLDWNTLILYLLMFFSSACLVSRYLELKNTFVTDFKGVANFLSLYGTFVFALLLVIPSAFISVNFGLNYFSFLGIFINANSPLFLGLNRMSSLGWEPGTFQLIVALYLLILVNEGAEGKKLVWIITVLILTGSSMGYINLLIVFLFFLLKNRKSLKIGLVVLIAGVLVLPILETNFYEKTIGENAGSGVIRLRDFTVGIRKISENPIVGFPVSELYNDPGARALEDKVWSASGIYSTVNSLGYFAGGYTNGLLGIFLNWGIPIGLFLLFLFYRSPIIRISSKRFTIFFMTIFLLSTLSEPITFTPFFFVFPISAFYRKEFFERERRKKSLRRYRHTHQFA